MEEEREVYAVSEMKYLENWNKVTKGLYRYVVGTNVAYEIHILYWLHDTDILTAKASLFIVGEWRQNINGVTYTERECLMNEQPVIHCLEKAVEDYKENMN